MKTYKGNNPETGSWTPVCSFEDNDCIEWVLWFKKNEDDHPSPWKNFKLVAQVPVLRKANYWIGCHSISNKVTMGRDVHLMKKHRPELYESILELWKEYGRDFNN